MFEAQRKLNEIIRQQHGAFAASQARAVGYSARMVKRRAENGEWQRLYPRVLTPASTPRTWHRDQMAACLWGFPALASGMAAGRLYGLPGCEGEGLEIITLNRKLVPHSAVEVHVTRRLPEEQRRVLDGIPVTSINRTLMDLCGRVPRRRAAIALDNALSRSLTTLGDIDHFLQVTARQGRNGCGILRELMKERIGVEVVATTPLETEIFQMLASSGLPMPKMQFPIRDATGALVARPDFVYPNEKLIIEGHSKLWHWGARAESEDLERHNRLCALGYTVLYVTWKDATQGRDQTIRTVGKLLRRLAA